MPTHASDRALQHIMMDLGTGNNNKINWAMTDKQEFIDITEVVYRGARKGRGLVVSVQQVQLVLLWVSGRHPFNQSTFSFTRANVL